MTSILQDVRLAVRQIVRKPATSAVVIGSLALGIGISTTIFALVNAVALRELGLPGQRPEEVVEVYTQAQPFGFTSYLNYLDLRESGAGPFTGLAARAPFVQAILADGERTRLLTGEAISLDFLELIELPPALGRGFRPEDAHGEPVALLGYSFWQRHFGADPLVLGRRLKLNGRELTVVGVVSQALRGSVPGFPTDFWLPLHLHDEIGGGSTLELRGAGILVLTGRLAPGSSLDQAQAQLDVLAQGLRAAHPDDNGELRLTLMPASEVLLAPSWDAVLFQTVGRLMALAGIVLLIACANVAGLLMARGVDRRQEIAVRTALGASRWRLVRLFLTESVLLALPGGLFGLLIAVWIAPLFVAFQPVVPIPVSLDLSPDARVFGFTLAVAIVAGAVSGLFPASRSARRDLASEIKGAGAAWGGERKLGLTDLVLLAQVALSTVLLVGAGLLVRSVGKAQAVDPGFQLRQGVVAEIDLGRGLRAGEESGRELYGRILERARELPGIRSAALVERLPLMPLGSRISERPVTFESGATVRLAATRISPGYFDTMGIPLVAGRDVTSADDAAAPSVIVVNEAAARRLWPGESPLGQRLRLGADAPWSEVVGVVGNGLYMSLREDPRTPQPFLYQPLLQDYSPAMTLVAAGSIDAGAAVARLRAELAALEPDLPIYDVKTMEDHVAVSLFLPRLVAVLFLGCGLLGLALGAAGIWGAVAHAAARRTREVAVRVAVGATRGDLVRLLAGRAVILTGVGVAVGLGSAGACRALLDASVFSALLFGVGTADPVTFVAVPLFLGLVALAASGVPALRASRVSPSSALRDDG